MYGMVWCERVSLLASFTPSLHSHVVFATIAFCYRARHTLRVAVQCRVQTVAGSRGEIGYSLQTRCKCVNEIINCCGKAPSCTRRGGATPHRYYPDMHCVNLPWHGHGAVLSGPWAVWLATGSSHPPLTSPIPYQTSSGIYQSPRRISGYVCLCLPA